MERYIGIDKTKIKSFLLRKIDREKFFNKNNCNIIYKQEGATVEVKDIYNISFNYSYLKVTDVSMFNTLIMGVKINKGVINPYSFIEIPISDKDEHNLIPLKCSEYHKLINEISEYLKDKYGLYIDFDTAKFDEIEINITANMELPFESYDYLLNQMVYLTPRIYLYSSFVGKKRITNQFEFFNKSVQVKIYDKSRQLNEKYKIKIGKKYMRIEYKLIKE